MDLDGQWKPPQLWPESTPPLPGWLRSADGRWFSPSEPTPPRTPPIGAINTARTSEPESDVSVDAGIGLSYASQSATPVVDHYAHEQERRRRAIVAALAAALIAATVGAAIIVVVLL